MPYIAQDKRNDLDSDGAPKTVGELKYVIVSTIDNFLEEVKPSYDVFASILGVMECVKMDVYRCLDTLHEDKRINNYLDTMGA